jgi:predicted small lipoprotein YifL
MEAPGEPKLRKRLIMKKLLAVLALSALAACGGDEAAEEPTTDATATESTMPVTDPAATTPMPSTMPMDSTGAAAGAAGATTAPMDSAGGNTTPEGAETTTP